MVECVGGWAGVWPFEWVSADCERGWGMEKYCGRRTGQATTKIVP